ncbi:hypothetical protein TNCV_296681 [Trichonephila clavipes]|nr:hypothetical protein TNCV_296681 [Trichonephila clavipes]
MSEFERGGIIGQKEERWANRRITRHMGPLEDVAYKTLLWPDRSPDPSPMNHIMGNDGNVDDLARQLEQICQEILQEAISVLYPSMSRLVAACFLVRWEERPQLGSDGSMLPEDYAPLHTDICIKQFLTRKTFSVMEHLRLIHLVCMHMILFLFPTVTPYLKGTQFTSAEEVQTK